MKEIYLTRDTPFDQYNATLSAFPSKVKDYAYQCPVLIFAINNRDVPTIKPTLEAIAKGGGIAISTDFTGMSKANALALLAHYEKGIAEFRAFIEENLS